MSDPERNREIVLDTTKDRADREAAIHDLEAANECDALADLVRSDDIAETYREQALSALAHPQCKSTLRELADGADLPDSLQEEAETLLGETPDDSGAGP